MPSCSIFFHKPVFGLSVPWIQGCTNVSLLGEDNESPGLDAKFDFPRLDS